MPYSETCTCGRIFTTPGAMKNHQNSCTTSKKRLSAVLANAKELFAVQKAKRLEVLAIRRLGCEDSQDLVGRDSESSLLSNAVSSIT